MTSIRCISLASSALLLLAAGCGGDDDGDGSSDVTFVDSGPGGGDPDSAPTPAACTAPESLGSLTIAEGLAQGTAEEGLLGGALLGEDAMPDAIQFEFYPGFEPFLGEDPKAPEDDVVELGTWDIAGPQLNYASCGVCVRLLTDLGESDYADDYMATGGTVTLTAIGPNLTITATNLTFGHVLIDEMSFESTPAGTGCESAADSVEFDVVIDNGDGA